MVVLLTRLVRAVGVVIVKVVVRVVAALVVEVPVVAKALQKVLEKVLLKNAVLWLVLPEILTSLNGRC